MASYPPQHHLLRDLCIDFVLRADGSFLVQAPLVDEVRNESGAFDLGAMCAVVDYGVCAAAMPMLDGDWVGTRDLTVTVGSPIVVGPLECVVHAVQIGGRLVTMRAEIADAGAGGSMQSEGTASAVATLRRMRRADTRADGALSGQRVGQRLSSAVDGSGFVADHRQTMGVVIRRAGVAELDKSDYVRNSFGTVNGGAQAVLAVAAAESVLGPGWTAVDMTFRYVDRAAEGRAQARATVTRAGDRGATVEVTLVDDDGCAFGLATVHLLR